MLFCLTNGLSVTMIHCDKLNHFIEDRDLKAIHFLERYFLNVNIIS